MDSSEPRNPAWGPSYPPLKPLKTHTSLDWMGLPWTKYAEFKTESVFPTEPGVYKIFDLRNQELLYLGETDNLNNRLKEHKRKFSQAAFSYSKLSPQIPHYQRLEIENDLIGYHYYITGRSPICQFKSEKSHRSS
jgi:hypothetical protein